MSATGSIGIMTERAGRAWPWWVAAAVVLLAGFWMRAANYHAGYGHPDEAITTEVVGHMRKSGDWDTNWAKAPTLEPGLRYDQYNFSSHLYATFAFYRVVKILPGTATWRGEDQGFWVYRFFSVLLGAVVVWQVLRLGDRLGGRGVALMAAALVAVAPILVQDAHFSRPEAFTTALSLAAVALCWPRSRLQAAAVVGGGFVIGLLVACKISMLLLGWLPLVPVLAAGGEETRRGRRWAVAVGAITALAAGFVVGVPGALAHPDVFVRGVKHLMEQYGGLHPPHSHYNGGPVGDMIGRYFVATLGWPMLAFGVIGVVALAVQRRGWELAVVAGPVVLFVGYFATRGVFFERNLSHVVPLLLLLAALGAWTAAIWAVRKIGASQPAASAGLIGVLLALLIVRPLNVSLPLVQEAFGGRVNTAREASDQAIQAAHPGLKWWETLLVNEGPVEELITHFKAGNGPVLLRVSDYNDEWSVVFVRRLQERLKAQPVGEYPGIFADQPISTLLTYHSPRERYFVVSGVR